jgi:hypothetical protein
MHICAPADSVNQAKPFLEFQNGTVEFQNLPIGTTQDYSQLQIGLSQVHTVKSIEFVAVPGNEAVGPSTYNIAIAQDEATDAITNATSYRIVAEGSLPQLVNGDSYHIKFEQPIEVRILRVIATPRHNQSDLRIAALRIWLDVEAPN